MFYTRFGRQLIDKTLGENFPNPDIWTAIEKLASCDEDEILHNLGTPDIKSKSDFIGLAFPVLDIGSTPKIGKKNDNGIIENLQILKNLDELLGKALKTQYFEEVYARYLELRKTANSKKLTQKVFTDLYKTSFSIMLDPEEGREHGKASLNMHNLGLLLNNELGEPKQRQYEICYNILADDIYHYRYIYDKFPSNAQFNSNTVEERQKSLRKLLNIIIDLGVFNILKALFLGKRTTLYTRRKVETYVTPELQAANDILLENGLVYNLFTANVINPLDREKQEENIIFCPSPFFIWKWHKDNRLNKRKVTFVVKDDYEALLLRLYFERSELSGIKREEYSFFSFSEWCNSTKFPRYSNVLIFRNTDIGNNSSKIKDILDRHSKEDAYIYSISSEHSFYDVGDISYDIANDDSFIMDSILRIPSKIGGKSPRRKVLWMARKRIYDDSSKEETANRTWTCNASCVVSDSHDKFLVLHSANPILFDFHSYLSSRESLREYIVNIGKSTEKIRKEAKYVNFSREIRIWYSESKGSKDKSKVRLDVYICNEVEDEQQEKRGIQKKDSIKRTGDKHPDDVVSYVLNGYPYDHLTRTKEGNLEVLEIRDILGDFYRQAFYGKAITLKTFVYIYPELRNKCSSGSYLMIENMSKSDLGKRIIDLISYDDYFSYLQQEYPDASASYAGCLEAISDMLDFAIDRGHASRNILEQDLQIKETDLDSRLAAQVRAALTKKSFTKSEFRTIYRHIIREINRNISSKSIGILIRLFTGLKSREVCALRWRDLCKVQHYEFFQLHVYARVSSDGKSIEPLRKKDEFRCIPIGQVLADTLLRIKKETKPSNDDFIVPGDNKKQPCRHQKLDKIGKTILEQNSICEDINIPVGGKNNTSDLNKYFGDIYRENFYFHGVRLARFNADEIAYFRGISKATTFGIYYCDYANINSQAVLYTKLRRLDTILLEESSINVEVRKISDNRINLFNRNSRFPIQLDIDIEPDENGESELSVDSTYGLRIISEDENEFF